MVRESPNLRRGVLNAGWGVFAREEHQPAPFTWGYPHRPKNGPIVPLTGTDRFTLLWPCLFATSAGKYAPPGCRVDDMYYMGRSVIYEPCSESN